MLIFLSCCSSRPCDTVEGASRVLFPWVTDRRGRLNMCRLQFLSALALQAFSLLDLRDCAPFIHRDLSFLSPLHPSCPFASRQFGPRKPSFIETSRSTPCARFVQAVLSLMTACRCCSILARTSSSAFALLLRAVQNAQLNHNQHLLRPGRTALNKLKAKCTHRDSAMYSCVICCSLVMYSVPSVIHSSMVCEQAGKLHQLSFRGHPASGPPT